MTTFAIVAVLPLVVYLLLVWTGVHNPYGIIELSQWLEGSIEKLTIIVDARKKVEEEIEDEYPNIILFEKITNTIFYGILIGTFITFWICWFFGAFK